MDKLVDLVKWMGDHPLSEVPFSEADALVLTCVSYFELKTFPFAPGVTYRLRDFAQAFSEGKINPQITGEASGFSELLHAVLHSERYGALLLTEYVDLLDPAMPLQFSAMAFRLDAQTDFLAFRGTDETIAGWQEDFMISFTETPSQRKAAEFASYVMQRSSKRFLFSGHSKGGNLALYAAAKLPQEFRDRIDHIYLLDSPGFCEEVFPRSSYADLLPKCSLIIPSFSVIGRIFEVPAKERKIVTSSNEGILQHSLDSWEIDHGKLHLIPATDPASDMINDTLDQFIEHTDVSSRKPLVDALFSALSADGAITLSDISGKGGTGFEAVLFRMFGISEDAKNALFTAPLRSIFGKEADMIRENGFFKWVKDSLFLHAILLILGGGLLILLRNTLLEVPVIVLFGGLAVFQIITTIRRLKENQWDFRKARYSVYLLIALLAMGTILILKENALFLFGSLIFGIGGLVLAYQAVLRFTRVTGFFKVLSLIEAVLLIIMSLFFLISSKNLFFRAALFIGIALSLDGAVRLVYLLIENHVRRKGSA